MTRRLLDRRRYDRGLAAYHSARYNDAREAAFVSGAVLFALIFIIMLTN